MEHCVQVKICGITNVDDAIAAAESGADFVGLILAESDRAVAPSVARQVLDRLGERTRGVLLFRDQPLAHVVDTAGRLGGRCIQLHGSESPDFIASLHAALPEVDIIRAWELRAAHSVDALLEHLAAVSQHGVSLYRIIVDVPKRGPRPDDDVFRLVAEVWSDELPGLWRAGGLTPETVAAALCQPRYVGVDVARGVESRPGRKDDDLVRRFIRAAKNRPAQP